MDDKGYFPVVERPNEKNESELNRISDAYIHLNKARLLTNTEIKIQCNLQKLIIERIVQKSDRYLSS